jgi:hypothetical protein
MVSQVVSPVKISQLKFCMQILISSMRAPSHSLGEYKLQ